MSKKFNSKSKLCPCDNCPHGEDKDTCQITVNYIMKNGEKAHSKGCKEWSIWYSNSWQDLKKTFGQTNK